LLFASGCGGSDVQAGGTAELGSTSGSGSTGSADTTGAEADSGEGDDVGTGDDSGDDFGTGDDSGGDEAVPTCSTDLQGELDRLGVPGLSAGIIANGRLVCAAVAGVADIEQGRPVTVDTAFQWASVSKTVVATAIMILVEEGQLELDDDVSAHLPYDVRNPSCPDDPITFRQLLTHTSSIIDNEEVYDASYTLGDFPIPLGEWIEEYVAPGGDYYDADQNFDTGCPGTYNEYSNIAVGGVVGHLVEEISGQEFDDFCRARIFEPLGMTETSFHLANLDVSNVAVEYEAVGGNFSRIGHVGYATYPDGLLRTSVPHLARFLVMMAEGGIYDGQRILSEQSTEEMARLQIPNLDATQGLIWYYDFDGELLGHDGEDDGASSLMFFDPTDGTGALLVGNAIWWDNGEEESLALFEALMDEAETY
jgi:CubicO group peptidase (beta-lactamase class C family)